MIVHLLQLFTQPTPPAVQRDPYVADRHLERISDFLVGQSLDFAEDNDTAAGFGQGFQRSQNPVSQLRGVGQSFGSGPTFLKLVQGVGIESDPGLVFTPPYGVDAGVSGDSDEPRPDPLG
jgi:hypothetical protein